MSDLQFTIASDSTRAQRDLRSLASTVQNIDKSVESTTQGFASLAKSIAVAASAFGALHFSTKISDSVTELNNKLNLVTDSTREFAVAQQLLVSTSSATRSTIASTVGVYSAFAKSLDRTKYSMDSMVRVSDIVQKSVAISGSTAESANAAIIQLAQGLQSGVLRGEEFNSIMEQTARLGQAIADGMGVTKGALRSMAEEGRLTADVVFNAIISQADKINSEFGKTAFTVRQGFQQLGDAISYTAGTALKATTVTDRFASALSAISGNIKDAAGDIEADITSVFTGIATYANNARTMWNAMLPFFQLLGERLRDIMPVVSLMQLRISSMFAITSFEGYIKGMTGIERLIDAVSLKSDTLRTILGNFDVDGIRMPTIGFRLRDLLSSADVSEFRQNAENLRLAFAEGEGRGAWTRVRDFLAPRELLVGIQYLRDGLAILGWWDDRMISITNIRFDVISNGIYQLRVAFKELLDYNNFTVIKDTLNDVKVFIYGIGVALSQMGERFDNVFGRSLTKVGELISRLSGASTTFRNLGKAVEYFVQLQADIFGGDKIFDSLRVLAKFIHNKASIANAASKSAKVVGNSLIVIKESLNISDVLDKAKASFVAISHSMKALAAPTKHLFADVKRLANPVIDVTKRIAGPMVEVLDKVTKPIRKIGWEMKRLAAPTKDVLAGFKRLTSPVIDTSKRLSYSSLVDGVEDIAPKVVAAASEIKSSLASKLSYVSGWLAGQGAAFVHSFYKGIWIAYQKDGFSTALLEPLVGTIRKLFLFNINLESFAHTAEIIGDSLANSIYNAVGMPFSVMIKNIVTLIKEGYKIVAEVLVTAFEEATRKNTAVDWFGSLMDRVQGSTTILYDVRNIIEEFTTYVDRLFFDLYDAVVGHSYWPDMVEGIIKWTDIMIEKVSYKLSILAKSVLSTFRDLMYGPKTLLDSLGMYLSKTNGMLGGNLYDESGSLKKMVSAISDLDFSEAVRQVKLIAREVKNFHIVNPFEEKQDVLSKFMPAQMAENIANASAEAIDKTMRVLSVAIVTGIAALIFPSVRSALGVFIGVQLAVFIARGIEGGFKSFMDISLFHEMGQSIGTTIGVFIKAALASIPTHIQVIFDSLEGFAKGLLDELGVVGTVIRGIANIFTLGNGNLITGLFGGAAGIAMLLHGKDIIKSIFTAMTGTTKLKDRGVFDTFFSKVFGGADRTLMLAGIATILSSFTDQVTATQATLIGFPLIMAAIMGRDVAWKVVLDLAKMAIARFVAMVGATSTGTSLLTKVLGADNAAAVGKVVDKAKGVLAKVFGVVSSISDKDRKEQYLSGKMGIEEYFKGTRDAAQSAATKFKYDPKVHDTSNWGLISKSTEVGPLLTTVGRPTKSKQEDKVANKEAIIDFRSMKDIVEEGLGSMREKWNSLSDAKKKYFKIAAGGIAIIGATMFSPEAKAATSTIDNIKNSVSSLASTIMENMIFIATAISIIPLVFKKVEGGWLSFAKKVVSSIGGIFSGIVNAIWTRIGLSFSFATIAARFGSLFAFIGKYLIGGLLGIATGGLAMLAGGLISVLIFGEGDTWKERLNNAYLDLKKFFGFREANMGVAGEIKAGISSAVEQRSAARPEFLTIKSRLSDVDFTKVGDKQVNKLKELAADVNKLDISIQEARSSGADVDEQDIEKLDKSLQQIAKILDRSSGTENLQSLRTRFFDMAKMRDLALNPEQTPAAIATKQMQSGNILDSQSTLLNSVVDNGLGATIKDAFQTFINGIKASPFELDLSRVSSLIADKWQIGDQVATLPKLIEDVYEFMPMDLQSGLVRAQKRMEIAQKEYLNANSNFWGTSKSSIDNAKFKMDRETEEFIRTSIEFVKQGQYNFKKRNFDAEMKTRAEMAKQAGVNLSERDNLMIGSTKGTPGSPLGFNSMMIDSQLREIADIRKNATKLFGMDQLREVSRADKMASIVEEALKQGTAKFTGIDANRKYLNEGSGLTLDSKDMPAIGVPNISSLQSIQANTRSLIDKANSIKMFDMIDGKLVTNVRGVQEYLVYMKQIKEEGKEFKRIIDSVKPPAEALAIRAQEMGLNADASNVARYGSGATKLIESAEERIRNRADQINALAENIANFGTASEFGAAASREIRKLEAEQATDKFRTNNTTDKINQRLNIKDSLEGLSLDASDAGISIDRDFLGKLGSNGRVEEFEKLLKRATSAMNTLKSTSSKRGMAEAQNAWESINNTIEILREKVMRTTASVFDSMLSMSGLSSTIFGKLERGMQKELVAKQKELLDQESDLKGLTGEAYLKARQKLDSDKEKFKNDNSYREINSFSSDFASALGVSLPENFAKEAPQAATTIIASMAHSLSKLKIDNPEWNFLKPDGSLMNAESYSKVMAETKRLAKKFVDMFYSSISRFTSKTGLTLDISEEDFLNSNSAFLSIEKSGEQIEEKIKKVREEIYANSAKGLDNAENNKKLAELLGLKRLAQGDLDKLIDPIVNGAAGSLKARIEKIGGSIDFTDVLKLTDSDKELVRSIENMVKLRAEADKRGPEGVGLVDAYNKGIKESTDLLNRRLELLTTEKKMTDSFMGSAKSSLANLFKTGDVGASVKGFMDSVSSSIIDNFVDNLANTYLKDIASDFGGFFKVGSTPARPMFVTVTNMGLPGGSSGGGFLGGIFDSIGSMFGLGDAMGSMTADAAMLANASSDPLTELIDIMGFASGGRISGPGSGTSDSILAKLSNGEFVMNAASTRKFLPVLESMNQGRLPAFASGGGVNLDKIERGYSSVSSQQKISNQQVINVNVTGDISRQTRSEIYSMLPNIAAGVNQHNHNRGYKG